MRLRVPGVEIQNITAAVWFWFVRRRIFLRERSQCAQPLSLEMKPKGIVERMPRFVPQNPHAFDLGAAFDFANEFALKLHQARVRQVKRNREPRYAVRREPFGRQPHMRLETNAAIV